MGIVFIGDCMFWNCRTFSTIWFSNREPKRE